MKNHKMYEADDKMIFLINDNHKLLQSLGAFGINLGFGEQTVQEVCEAQNVDTYTFLAIVNYAINGYREREDIEKLSIPTVIQYLKASHSYFLGFQLPFIRKQLVGALDVDDNLAKLILKLYDEYAHSIRLHMQYEERTIFPYIDSLQRGEPTTGYDLETFAKHHTRTEQQLRELKNIIIKYLPTDGLHNNQLYATLFDIYSNDDWLSQHARVEEEILMPAITHLERKLKKDGVSLKITQMINKTGGESTDTLSDREKDVVVSLVQGMTNKEIAEHLFISVNTVITHRRNIARKLQIHSVAGLTIYAIANNLVDISSI